MIPMYSNISHWYPISHVRGMAGGTSEGSNRTETLNFCAETRPEIEKSVEKICRNQKSARFFLRFRFRVSMSDIFMIFHSFSRISSWISWVCSCFSCDNSLICSKSFQANGECLHFTRYLIWLICHVAVRTCLVSKHQMIWSTEFGRTPKWVEMGAADVDADVCALETEADGSHIQEHFLQFLEVQRVPIQYGCMAAWHVAVHISIISWLLGTEGLGSGWGSAHFRTLHGVAPWHRGTVASAKPLRFWQAVQIGQDLGIEKRGKLSRGAEWREGKDASGGCLLYRISFHIWSFIGSCCCVAAVLLISCSFYLSLRWQRLGETGRKTCYSQNIAFHCLSNVHRHNQNHAIYLHTDAGYDPCDPITGFSFGTGASCVTACNKTFKKGKKGSVDLSTYQ